MKIQATLLYTVAPWLFYFAGETSGHLAIGAGVAVLAMLIWQVTGWYRLKSTDWTQLLYFALVLLSLNWTPLSSLVGFRPLLAPGLFSILAFGSLLIGHPFTNQFAREQIPAYFWNDPQFPIHFARVNRILTLAWGINFCVALACAWITFQKTSIHPWLLHGTVIASFIAVGTLTRFFPPWYEKHVYVPKNVG